MFDDFMSHDRSAMKIAMPGLLKAKSAKVEPSCKYYKMGVQQSSTRKSGNLLISFSFSTRHFLNLFFIKARHIRSYFPKTKIKKLNEHDIYKLKNSNPLFFFTLSALISLLFKFPILVLIL